MSECKVQAFLVNSHVPAWLSGGGGAAGAGAGEPATTPRPSVACGPRSGGRRLPAGAGGGGVPAPRQSYVITVMPSQFRGPYVQHEEKRGHNDCLAVGFEEAMLAKVVLGHVSEPGHQAGC